MIYEREPGRARIATPPCGSEPPRAQPRAGAARSSGSKRGPGNTPVLTSGRRLAVNSDPERIMSFCCVSATEEKKGKKKKGVIFY